MLGALAFSAVKASRTRASARVAWQHRPEHFPCSTRKADDEPICPAMAPDSPIGLDSPSPDHLDQNIPVGPNWSPDLLW